MCPRPTPWARVLLGTQRPAGGKEGEGCAGGLASNRDWVDLRLTRCFLKSPAMAKYGLLKTQFKIWIIKQKLSRRLF